MGVVFINIEDQMLNMACAALIGTANSMTLHEFQKKKPMPYPNAPNLCVAITAIMRTMADNCNHTGDDMLPVFIHVLEQSILNLKAVEGPKRV